MKITDHVFEDLAAVLYVKQLPTKHVQYWKALIRAQTRVTIVQDAIGAVVFRSNFINAAAAKG